MSNLGSVVKKVVMENGTGVIVNQDLLKLIQKKLLLMFDDILEVCEKEHIKYQLSGGSALGAVRHKGFIPWDDDIDINMTRSDIKRFIPAFKRKYGDKYWIKVLGQTPDYDYLMIHIMAKDVRARALMEPANQDNGLCIDIFPMENTYNDPIRRKIHGYGCMFFRYILSCLRFKHNKKEVNYISKHNDEFRKYASTRLKISKIASILPDKFWYKMSVKWYEMCKNDNSKYVVIPAGTRQFFGEMYERKKFCKSVKMLFDGRKVNVSADYDNYLHILYNDYMTIPPIEKQETHVLMELDVEALKKSIQTI
ncbi:MAG: LicD family protein [Ruminococcus sp.]|nr:LicD family protein [Ruminococcus sp.]